ncbi:DUF2513 domain-containing protein [Turicimonas sp. TL08]
MRRNIKTLVSTLRALENGKIRAFISDVENEGVNTQYRLFHLLLLKEAGYCSGLDVKVTSEGFEPEYWQPRLTNKGCDFLDMTRAPKLFNKVKEIVQKSGVPLTTFTMQQIVHESIEALLWEYSKERLKEKESFKRGK